MSGIGNCWNLAIEIAGFQNKVAAFQEMTLEVKKIGRGRQPRQANQAGLMPSSNQHLRVGHFPKQKRPLQPKRTFSIHLLLSHNLAQLVAQFGGSLVIFRLNGHRKFAADAVNGCQRAVGFDAFAPFLKELDFTAQFG